MKDKILVVGHSLPPLAHIIHNCIDMNDVIIISPEEAKKEKPNPFEKPPFIISEMPVPKLNDTIFDLSGKDNYITGKKLPRRNKKKK